MKRLKVNGVATEVYGIVHVVWEVLTPGPGRPVIWSPGVGILDEMLKKACQTLK